MILMFTFLWIIIASSFEEIIKRLFINIERSIIKFVGIFLVASLIYLYKITYFNDSIKQEQSEVSKAAI